MSCSDKQRQANQANAKKSTGPKTQAGKQKASSNATRHGMFSSRIIINSPYLKEDRVEFELLIENLRSEFLPESFTEDFLVQKIASCIWRMRRIIGAETSQVEIQLDDIKDSWKYRKILGSLVNQVLDEDVAEHEAVEDYVAKEVGLQSVPNEEFSRTLLRYELRLDRQLTRSYRMLGQMQRRRVEREEKMNQANEKKKRDELLGGM